MKKRLSIVVLILTVCMLFSACSSSSGKMEQIKTDGKLVVYTNANFPPFEYLDGTSIAGVDMEIASEIADALDVELEVNDADFDGIIMSLASGKGDIAISGFTITEERKEQVDFSKPYINSVQYMILPKDSKIETMEDLAEKKVGVAMGYTGQFVIEDEVASGTLSGGKPEVVIVNSAVDGALDVQNGKMEAMIMDEYVAKKVASENDGLKAVKLVYKNGDDVSEEYGIAVPKGNEDLLKEINAVIDKLVEDGKIEQWVAQHSE